MDLMDKPTSARDGEGLDTERIGAFIRDSIPGLRGEISILQFPSGYSNLTYLLTIGGDEFVLRRPPFGSKAKTAHDMAREFRILTALHPVFPYCPRPLLYSEDASIIGAPFYVMERMRGIILRRDLPPGFSLPPDQARRLCERVVDVHLELHSIDFRAIGLDTFGKPEGYVGRQVSGWIRRYRAARTPDAPDGEEVMAWIAENAPKDSDRPAVIHNDYRLDNLVLDAEDPLRIIGVLDWEMAAIGDPLMDLGASLAYWVQPDDPPEMNLLRMIPSNIEGAMTRKEIVARYLERSNRPNQDLEFYYCFGLFRLGVIAQQIYYRFYHGQTRDERFRSLVFAVTALDNAASKVVKRA
jgi:aminoglycoside phosphotransferase (APT) family kinase protein